MGSKCFRPVNQNRQPVYLTSILRAFDDANLFYAQKNNHKPTLEDISQNELRKGNLKKLFDHLNSHQAYFVPSLQLVSKITSQEKNIPAIVICNMFCQQLIKLLSNKTNNFTLDRQKNSSIKPSSKVNSKIVNDQQTLKNIIHAIQSHFFQLSIKILVYSKQKSLKNSISQSLIQYSTIFNGKITAKKQLKTILDLYLTVIFEKNIQLIDKNSFLPFYAYSTLISKSKTQLFTSDFINKHFSFILKLFFQLQDVKQSNRTIAQSEDFNIFQESVQNIIKQFLIFTSQNKRLKDYILMQLMLQEDNQKFHILKTIKLQRVICESLEDHSRQHFMFDWLGYLIRYIGKNFIWENETINENFMESLQEVQVPNFLNNLMKNNASPQSKGNAIQTLKRWFQSELLNTEKTLEHFSHQILQAFLLNLYNPDSKYQEVNHKSKVTLRYFLKKRPEKLKELLIILNYQMRKNMNHQIIKQSSSRLSINNFSGGQKLFATKQEQAVQGLWKNSINFIKQETKANSSQIFFKNEEVQQIYAPLVKSNRRFISIIYLIELEGVSIKYSDLKNEKVQSYLSNFLISLNNSIKIQNSEIEIEFVEKFKDKGKYLLSEICLKNQQILQPFLKHSFKSIFKDDNNDQMWVIILIQVILINLVLEQHKNKNSGRAKKLNTFLSEVLQIIRNRNSKAEFIYNTYTQNRDLFDFGERVTARWEVIKLKAMEHLEMSSEALPKSLTNMEKSALSSRVQVSDSNPDLDFKNIYQMIFQK